ncbi:hypothetical protein MMC30_004954 [Trapelia coarctata]|nr:hypothetical protein [Trapelia coarctata]
MVYFKDSQTWLQQSTLLLEARPTTTRISTRYTLLPPSHPSLNRTSKSHPSTTSDPAPPARAHIVLKSYDPVSGTCLKYRTDKTAEVGRLVAGLGRCARVMAALPPKQEEVEGKGGDGGTGAEEEDGRMEGMVSTGAGVKEGGGAGPKDKKAAGGKGGAGGGKKKKGKR